MDKIEILKKEWFAIKKQLLLEEAAEQPSHNVGDISNYTSKVRQENLKVLLNWKSKEIQDANEH